MYEFKSEFAVKYADRAGRLVYDACGRAIVVLWLAKLFCIQSIAEGAFVYLPKVQRKARPVYQNACLLLFVLLLVSLKVD